MIVYKCGCSNNVQPGSGLLYCVSKCQHHRDFLRKQPKGADYYKMLGAVTEDPLPSNAPYLAELLDGVGELPEALPGGVAVEIGGGASPYVAALLRRGYRYIGIEPDPWAATWTRNTYGAERVTMIEAAFPVELSVQADLILCAHALEHMADAPAAVATMHKMLNPGGTLIVVVPDDRDPVNPDHLWFFTAESLKRLVERCGFHDVRVEVRPHPHENYIYLRATAGDITVHG